MNVDLTTHYLGILFRRLEATKRAGKMPIIVAGRQSEAEHLSAPRGFCGFGNKLGLELSANLRALSRIY